ncbi:hypothetical protein AWJ20_3750 [Sugiyamaella lignohabitans]|uniref:AB hydrolase-1 domain-containing protein n=1 Tax=Sugiyamaella lignohabitans TaxID=796027 RepID=A0A167BXS2_9ASCO|nr:uncharacterized protein AWJ20_3750 [Sugiyamaella lignohabitans]ANB10956.1 hypothetical protein AWJ20_3750 [Sugiyamaella lignohabitans]
MPTVVLPNHTLLSFSDTGRPHTGQYETVVLCHGVGSNIRVFESLNEVVRSGQVKIRLLAYNQRGYSGSSPLPKGNLKKEEYALEHATDLVEFLEYANEDLKLPKPPIVVGWSKGTNLLIAIACQSFLPTELRQRGLKYSSAFVLYEPPSSIFALKPDPAFTKAMTPPEGMSKEEQARTLPQRFEKSFGVYYEYPDPNSIEGAKPATNVSEPAAVRELILSAKEPHMIPHGFTWAIGSAKYQRQAVQEALTAKLDIPVLVVWNGMTAPYCKQAALEAHKMGGRVVQLWNGGNHYAFVGEPRRWLTSILTAVHDSSSSSKL